jgi:hypothetical protein
MSIKISQFENANQLDGNEIIPILQGGINKRTTIGDIIKISKTGIVEEFKTLTDASKGNLAFLSNNGSVFTGSSGFEIENSFIIHNYPIDENTELLLVVEVIDDEYTLQALEIFKDESGNVEVLDKVQILDEAGENIIFNSLLFKDSFSNKLWFTYTKRDFISFEPFVEENKVEVIEIDLENFTFAQCAVIFPEEFVVPRTIISIVYVNGFYYFSFIKEGFNENSDFFTSSFIIKAEINTEIIDGEKSFNVTPIYELQVQDNDLAIELTYIEELDKILYVPRLLFEAEYREGINTIGFLEENGDGLFLQTMSNNFEDDAVTMGYKVLNISSETFVYLIGIDNLEGLGNIIVAKIKMGITEFERTATTQYPFIDGGIPALFIRSRISTDSNFILFPSIEIDENFDFGNPKITTIDINTLNTVSTPYQPIISDDINELGDDVFLWLIIFESVIFGLASGSLRTTESNYDIKIDTLIEPISIDSEGRGALQRIIPDPNLFIGIYLEDVVADSDVQILLNGILTTESGLEVGKNYYLRSDGSGLTLVPEKVESIRNVPYELSEQLDLFGYALKVGKAISTNKFFLDIDKEFRTFFESNDDYYYEGVNFVNIQVNFATYNSSTSELNAEISIRDTMGVDTNEIIHTIGSFSGSFNISPTVQLSSIQIDGTNIFNVLSNEFSLNGISPGDTYSISYKTQSVAVQITIIE